jgi:hypothetical protein
MSIFSAETMARIAAAPIRLCGCGLMPKLIKTLMNSQNGRTIRLFKCECGDQSWSEDRL